MSVAKKIICAFNRIDSESKELSNKMKFIILIFLGVLFFSGILLLNIMTPFRGDDFMYLFKYNSIQRVQSLFDVLESQHDHYFLWGGRSVVHTFLQAILCLPPLVVDILNSIVYLLFIFVVYFHAKGLNRNHNISFFILIAFFTWFLLPAYAENVLWITGSVNYLWGFVISLSFLLPYRLYHNTKKQFISEFVSSPLMFFSGILSGWTNENIGAMLLFMIILFIGYHKYKKNKIPLWMYLGMIGVIIGFLFMILAPGNYIRSELFGTPKLNLFHLYYKFNVTNKRFFDNLGLFNVVVLVLFLTAYRYSKHRKNLLFYVFLYGLALLVAIYSMLLSPTFPARAWFGVVCMNILVLGIIIFNLDFSQKYIRFILYSIVVFILLSFPFSFYLGYKDIKAVNNCWKERFVEIEKARNENKTSIIFKQISATTQYGLGDYISEDYDKYMSSYYEISIKTEE